MSIQIGELAFRTKAEAERHIRVVLQRWRDKTHIGEPDKSFVLALLEMHPRAALIKDCGLAGIRVQSLGRGQYRFLAVRTDSSIRDFSWRNCLTPRPQRAQVMSICRSIVIPQISEFRRAFWDGKTVAFCPVSGAKMTPLESDVDHIPPDTFAALVERWLHAIRMEFDEVEIVHKREYETRSEFSEAWLETDWAEFHQDNAKLRVISQVANRSLLRRSSC